MWGVFGTDSFLARPRKKFCVGFVAKGMVMVIYFGIVLSLLLPPPLQHVRDLPEFASPLSLDRGNWPRCLLWRGAWT